VERIIRTNFLANVYAAEALLGSFSDRIAHWCVVSSSASFLPMPRGEAYGASKAALSYFFESLALSYPNILTTMVHPGFVKTPLTDKNDFPMPMIASANSSAAAILKGIANGKREVNHPWLFTRILRLLGRMPIGLRRAIGKAMIKSQDS
jgi:short-subunit dehydrogenase